MGNINSEIIAYLFSNPSEARVYVMDRLHPKGKHSIGNGLRHGRWEQAYLLGDGFGKVTRDWAEDQCWDWSHIRESGDEAINRIVLFLIATS